LHSPACELSGNRGASASRPAPDFHAETNSHGICCARRACASFAEFWWFGRLSCRPVRARRARCKRERAIESPSERPTSAKSSCLGVADDARVAAERAPKHSEFDAQFHTNPVERQSHRLCARAAPRLQTKRPECVRSYGREIGPQLRRGVRGALPRTGSQIGSSNARH